MKLKQPNIKKKTFEPTRVIRIPLLNERGSVLSTASDFPVLMLNVAEWEGQSKDGKTRFRRQTPLLIKNRANNRSIIRLACGGHGTKHLTKNTIAIDYDAARILDIPVDLSTPLEDVDIEISEATKSEIHDWYLNHPDPAIRFAWRQSDEGVRLGKIGMWLGFLSLGLGVYSLVITLYA